MVFSYTSRSQINIRRVGVFILIVLMLWDRFSLCHSYRTYFNFPGFVVNLFGIYFLFDYTIIKINPIKFKKKILIVKGHTKKVFTNVIKMNVIK
jgi:hypothetical protein